MQRNNTPILIGTILFGLLALGITVVMFLKPAGPPQPVVPVGTPAPPPPKSVWVAAHYIPPRVRITVSDLKKKSVKMAAITPDTVTDISQVEGMLTKAPIAEEDPIQLSQFEKPLARVVSASMEIPTGYRAVGVWVDPEQTAAGLVDVGDRVDVVATHRLSWDKGPNQYYVGASTFSAGRTIGTNLLVLGVKKSLDAPPPMATPAPGAPPVPAPAPTPAPAPNPGQVLKVRVVVAAKPEVAARLVAANDMGTLHITIRNPLDDDEAPVKSVTEYPSRLVTIKPMTQKEVGNIASTFSQKYIDTWKKNFPDDFKNQPSTPPLTGFPTSAPSTDREITVIRGTEKTRAIVPAR